MSKVHKLGTKKTFKRPLKKDDKKKENLRSFTLLDLEF